MSNIAKTNLVLLLSFTIVFLIGCGALAEESPEAPPPAATDPAMAARLEGVRRALEQGMDVDKTDPEGRTLLMMSAFEGYSAVVDLLIESGAKVNQRDAVGRTAIMYASSGPFPKTVGILARNGADVNLVDTVEGWTALMFAAAEGHQPVVKVLLQEGANIETADEDGDTAIDHARQREQADMVTLLESWPGRQPVKARSTDR